MTSFNSDINFLLQSMPKICKKTILLICLISPYPVSHRLRGHFWILIRVLHWTIWRVSIPISICYCNLCQKSARRQYYSCVWSRPVLHRLRDHVWYVFCSAQWRIWRDSIPISIWYCNLCQKSAIRQYYSFVWSRPVMFYTDLEIIFDKCTVLHSEGFDEFQFQY